MSLGPRGSKIFLKHVGQGIPTAGGQVTYEVDINNLPKLLQTLFEALPPQIQKDAAEQIRIETETNMKTNCPINKKPSTYVRTTKSLKSSIKSTPLTITKDEITFSTGPTKKVGGHDLGLMVEKGSTNRRIILPKNKKYLKFYWEKTGQIHFAKAVKRGIIKPNPFVERTWIVMKKRAPEILIEKIRMYYGSVTP